ncbi:MAG: aldo/keto reductase [Candidatus Bathyarchaeota archaeon]|nr:aldo/keto reductase [Candidatus Bathyarchaeota archaeon]
MNKRRLGRTGLQVSQVGFGGTWIAQLSPEEATKVVRTAFDLGITYFDTAKWDGDSEEKIGNALKGVRDECVIATKTGSRTKRESLQDLKESLKLLQTDRLDIIQLHGIDDERTLQKATGPDGVLQTCKEARREGLVDFVGITSHRPRVLVKAIDTGEFDSVLVPLNVVTRQALEELVPYAKTHDVGVIAMKPYFAKTSKLITCFYQPSLSLLSDEPELHALLGQDTDAMARSALRFVLSQDIAVTIAGLQSVAQVEAAAKAGNEFSGLTADEKQRFAIELGDQCRDCGLCLPCPQNVDVPHLLAFQSISRRLRITELGA